MIKVPIPWNSIDPKEPSYSANQKFCAMDLARSGLTIADMPIFIESFVVVANQFVHGVATAATNAFNYYTIPYYYGNGDPVVDANGHAKMYRKRTTDGERRYLSPSRDLAGELVTMPYFCPLRLSAGHKNGRYVIVEGEKKYAKLLKEEHLYGCAIGGKDMWREGNNLHPLLVADILDYAAEEVLIVPDGDWHRQDIFASYSMLVFKLRERFDGTRILVADISGIRTVDGDRLGIDDYLHAGHSWADVNIVDLEHELLLPPNVLIERYGLEVDENRQGIQTIRQNHSNVEKLLRQHPLFNKDLFWFDADNNTPVFRGEGQNWLVNATIALQRYCRMSKLAIDAVKWAGSAIYDTRIRSIRKEWMRSLKWDGTDHIGPLFAECVETDRDPEPYRKEAAKRLMLQMVARCLNPGCKADTMIILVSPQGRHKSMFWEELSYGSFATLGSDVSAKDTQMLIHSKFMVVIGELDWMNRAEDSKVKRFITETQDTYRPPYRHGVITQLRKCVFVGDSNNVGILRDKQNRRFMPLMVSNINMDWLRTHREQLYAQAVAMYDSGEKWWSEDENEWEEAKQIFQEGVPFAKEVESAMEACRKAGTAHRIPDKHKNKHVAGKEGFEIEDLAVYLSQHRLTPKAIGGILGRMGYDVHRVKISGEKQRNIWVK
jgi:hypothetical protein